MTPLLKEPSPEEFKKLRPIIVLEGSSKPLSRPLLQVAEEFDVGTHAAGVPDTCMLGFRQGGQRMELRIVIRNTVETCTEWDIPLIICQFDFVGAYDSVRHEAVCNVMYRRGVPVPVITAYLRDMRSAEFVFVHGQWRTRPVSPAVGLPQGCSLSLLVFRWCMEDLADEARELWQEEGNGLELDIDILLLGWAGGLYVFATDVDSMEKMAASTQALAEAQIGLALRPDKCKWAKVLWHDGPDATAKAPTPLLGEMHMQSAEQCLRVLGAQVQVDGSMRSDHFS